MVSQFASNPKSGVWSDDLEKSMEKKNREAEERQRVKQKQAEREKEQLLSKLSLLKTIVCPIIIWIVWLYL